MRICYQTRSSSDHLLFLFGQPAGTRISTKSSDVARPSGHPVFDVWQYGSAVALMLYTAESIMVHLPLAIGTWLHCAGCRGKTGAAVVHHLQVQTLPDVTCGHLECLL